MIREMKPYADRIDYDGLGSVIASRGTSGPKIMIDAHMDELGGIVRRITPGGFITMEPLGGFLDRALVGQRWNILGSKGPTLAVSGIRDGHLISGEERSRAVPAQEIFLDVGAHSAAEVAALGIEAGDPIAPDSKFAVMADGHDVIGKAFDDRAGCAILIEVLRRLSSAPALHSQLFFAATVQEELGARGARTAASMIAPDVGISIEGGVVGDTPDARPDDSQSRLGGGPSLFLFAGSELPSRALVDLVKKVAKDNTIPLQLDLVKNYGDDASQIQEAAGGAPVINIGVPLRYTHAHNSVMDRADFDRTIDLVFAVVERLDAAAVVQLRAFTHEPR